MFTRNDPGVHVCARKEQRQEWEAGLGVGSTAWPAMQGMVGVVWELLWPAGAIRLGLRWPGFFTLVFITHEV